MFNDIERWKKQNKSVSLGNATEVQSTQHTSDHCMDGVDQEEEKTFYPLSVALDARANSMVSIFACYGHPILKVTHRLGTIRCRQDTLQR